MLTRGVLDRGHALFSYGVKLNLEELPRVEIMGGTANYLGPFLSITSKHESNRLALVDCSQNFLLGC
jgi:hypothetical protein